MTTYEKRQEKLLTKSTIVSLFQDLNGETVANPKGYCLALKNGKSNDYEVVAFFDSIACARRVRRIMRSIMAKAFDEIHTISLVKVADLV